MAPARLLAAALALAGAASAQDPAFHAAELGSFFQAGAQYADVWGDGTHAYVGHFGQSVIDVLDVSNPASPVLVASFAPASPNTAASAQDVKVANGLLFISLESGGSDGVEIVDVRNPAAPVSLTRVDAEPGPYELIHNVSYDAGWLYLCDSSNPSIAILDLRGYDPDAAPATITTWSYELTGVGNTFVHDVTVANGRLWVSAWDSTQVFDVSNLGAQAPVWMGQALGVSAHAVWPTDDGRFVVSTEERGGGAIRLYEVLDDGSTVTFVQRDSWANPRSGGGSSYSAHNPVLVGDRVYVSNYSAGVLALQIDRVSRTLRRVASFDTSVAAATGFAGCWGVYPGLGEDRVLVSDIENGVSVLDMRALELTNPNGRPNRLLPDAPQNVEVAVRELGLVRDDATVTLHASVDGAPATAATMTAVGGEVFRGQLPGAPCGARVDYWFTAADTQGATFAWPPGAPAETFTEWTRETLDPVLLDDFEADLGWTVTNTSVSTGAWTRVDPVETGAQPGAGVGGGATCWVTGQGAAGGSVGAADLDGGPTRLTSPLLDFSAGDGRIEYSRWLFNDDVDADALTVEVSNDGGSSWTTVESVSGEAGGWVEHAFRVSDFVAPTSQVVVRFSAVDQPNNSITEAAIDAFRAERFGCPVVALASATERNGSGLNPACLGASGGPVLGTVWTPTVDAAVRPSAVSTWILAYGLPLDGATTPWGELLVAGAPLLTSSVASTGGLDAHALAVPNAPGLAGFTAHAQAVVVGGGGATLCNALDLVLGY